MKNLTLLILSILLLSCSSDDEELGFEKEGNFLDVYNGVIWKNYNASNDISYWFVFTPSSKTEAEGIGAMCTDLTYKWGVEDSYGDKYTIKENSTNLLIYDYKCSEGVSCNYTRTVTVLENGNALKIVDNEGGIEIVNKVTTKPCE